MDFRRPTAATCYQNLRKCQPFWHPFTQCAVLFAIALVAFMFARAPQNTANLVLAVQKQKGEIVELYRTETVGCFDIDKVQLWPCFDDVQLRSYSKELNNFEGV